MESDGSNAQMMVFPVKTLTKICIDDCEVVQILKDKNTYYKIIFSLST
jgi:hypothetical protein